MDFSFVPNSSSTNPPHTTFTANPPEPPPPIPHPRRHTRYSVTNPNVPPPHVVINTRRRRSPHRRLTPQNAMSASPPAVQGSSHISVSVDSLPPPPPPNGHDHNAMETDEDSDRYEESEGDDDDDDDDDGDEEERPGQGQVPNGVDPPSAMEDSLMDTSPDHPNAPVNGAPQSATDQASQTRPTTITHLEADSNGLISVTLPDDWTGPMPSLTHDGGGQIQIHTEAELLALEAAARRSDAQHEVTRTPVRDRPERARQQGRREERRDDDDDGSDSDESMDEPDHPYWAHFKPDTSAPDDNEMAAIEESDEPSATDHEYWEKATFEPLDDPEYVPSDTGRISWTLKGHHGTPEKPNRLEIMRSPSVLIGGLYWNIKYYPRGNDGTDYMSVYIECSPRPYEDDLKEKTPENEPAVDDGPEEKIPVENATSNGEIDNGNVVNGAPVVEGTPALERVHGVEHSQTPEVDMEASMVLPSEGDQGEEIVEIVNEPPWSAAAQVACVIYNPEEPRTFAHQKSKHQYYNENPDWGWTRFHGPWSEIHLRRRCQRKPLLENDTLAFTVYLQVVQDRTKSLWWHPSESRPSWDSMSLLGLRGLRCKEHHASAMVAAVSAWMHLGCLVDKLCGIKIPSRFTKAGEQLLPALNEFQDILRKEGSETDSSDVSLSSLSQVIAFFYGSDMDSRKDVVMVWGALRRVLNLEASLAGGHEYKDKTIDLFSDVAMLMQPDPFDLESQTNQFPKFPIQSDSSPIFSSVIEPGSVQEAIQATSHQPSKAFRLWRDAGKYDQPVDDMPTVLKIELHRQQYNKDTRKWRKLSHKIALDEKIACNGQEYTLYGMIVHAGGLDYHEYYSVLRPDGPGTRWLKYAGETSSTRSVEVLTTKQAVTDHEGSDSAPESAAVAYITLYVRTDKVSQVLSGDLRKETLREAAKADALSTVSDFKPGKMPIATPFRVGKRDWCAAFEVDEIYDSIRGAGHLSRSFYRTEGLTSALGHFQMNESQVAEKIEKAKQICSEEHTDESKAEESTPKTASDEPVIPQIVIFVKQFDTSQQRFIDRGGFRPSAAANVVHFLREQLKIEKDEAWDFYHEHTILIKSKHLIKRSATFYDLSYGGEPWDGVLIIAQRRPTAEETKALEDAGKCLNPMEYSYYLLGDHNPIFYASHLTMSYFTNPYLSVPLSYGRAHGHGTHIALSGSAYTGPYRCGRKAGANGTMHYANGDTYVGDWAYDEPNGQGTMTYAKTGNVYTGGWKKRLRFGKGTMKYEVADQEMMLCGVCYEKNMDAVFCFCGHVVACEECARKIDICPVCREPVKKVLVLKGATGGSGAPSEWAGGKEGGGDIGMIP